MELDPWLLVSFAAIAFIASFVYGVTGFGSGLISIPLASHFYDMRFVLAVFALIDCVNAIRVAMSQPRAVVREEAVRLIPSCIAGVVLGAAFIVVLPASMLMLALSATIVVLVALFPQVVAGLLADWMP